MFVFFPYIFIKKDENVTFNCSVEKLHGIYEKKREENKMFVFKKNLYQSCSKRYWIEINVEKYTKVQQLITGVKA